MNTSRHSVHSGGGSEFAQLFGRHTGAEFSKPRLETFSIVSKGFKLIVHHFPAYLNRTIRGTRTSRSRKMLKSDASVANKRHSVANKRHKSEPKHPTQAVPGNSKPSGESGTQSVESGQMKVFDFLLSLIEMKLLSQSTSLL